MPEHLSLEYLPAALLLLDLSAPIHSGKQQPRVKRGGMRYRDLSLLNNYMYFYQLASFLQYFQQTIIVPLIAACLILGLPLIIFNHIRKTYPSCLQDDVIPHLVR